MPMLFLLNKTKKYISVCYSFKKKNGLKFQNSLEERIIITNRSFITNQNNTVYAEVPELVKIIENYNSSQISE